MDPCQLSQSYLEISRADLQSNAKAVFKAVQCPVIGVVKCDGYGVSIPEAAAAWKSAGVTMFAVSEATEALELRRAGFSEDILLLSPVSHPETIRQLLRAGVMLTVTGPDCASRYTACADSQDPVRVHVAIDTGMGRFGLRWSETEAVRALYQTPGLAFEGIFSHFSASFEAHGTRTRTQLRRFLSLTGRLEEHGVPVGIRHMANSCAALRFPETRLDAVRIGSALVGRLPVSVPVPLRRVGRYQALVVDCKTLKKGDTTGYASLCRVRRDTRVAIAALGYHTGFGLEKQPQAFRLTHLLRQVWSQVRSFRCQPTVWYQGRELPVVGRIGTQFTLVDIGSCEIQPGDFLTANVDMMLPPPARRYV